VRCLAEICESKLICFVCLIADCGCAVLVLQKYLVSTAVRKGRLGEAWMDRGAHSGQRRTTTATTTNHHHKPPPPILRDRTVLCTVLYRIVLYRTVPYHTGLDWTGPHVARVAPPTTRSDLRCSVQHRRSNFTMADGSRDSWSLRCLLSPWLNSSKHRIPPWRNTLNV